MNESTSRVLEQLLDVDAPRPPATPGLAAAMRQRLVAATVDAIARLGGRSLHWSKTRHLTAGKCMGLAKAAAATPYDPDAPLPVPVLAGMAVHAAVEASSACPGLTTDQYVRGALSEVRRQRPGAAEQLSHMDAAELAGVVSTITNALHAWRADWPELDPRWARRWEVSMRTTIDMPGCGGLVLTARPDLILGAAGRGKVNMLLVDLKNGALRQEHAREARFHALVALLRWNEQPWRSTCYSVATGAWTHPPDVTADTLATAVDEVSESVVQWVDSVELDGPPVLTPGPHCSYCVAAPGCPAAGTVPGGADVSRHGR